MKGNIHSIETLGLHDGPGVRSVIFFQGCHLRCKYCHNPDTWTTRENKIYSVKELIREISSFKNYYNASGGGVTLSGGEALMQPKFLVDFCKKLKREKIHVALDTSGIGLGVYEEILEYVDLVILDLKHHDPDKFRALTHQKIDEIYNFIDALNHSTAKVWIRSVIIEGINDQYKHIKGLSEMINIINRVEKVELLPFRKMCLNKYKAMNIEFPFEDKRETNEEKVKFLSNTINQLI